MLDDPGNDRNLVVWSWCGQADTTEANMQTYLDLMSDLEADYPDVTFVYMTGHLNGSGEEGNLYARNNQIRNHCIANGCALFDFADIESYDPDGDYFRDLYADDGCNYNGGNWANEWCADHSGDPLCATCSCAHSLALNCNMKARAFWWLLARMAGWDGTPGGDFDCDDAVDTGRLHRVCRLLQPAGTRPGRGRHAPPVTSTSTMIAIVTTGLSSSSPGPPGARRPRLRPVPTVFRQHPCGGLRRSAP